jgi:hypothetical protein
MRIIVGLIVIILIGGILTAAYTLQPNSLSPAQLNEIQSNCAACHSIPPVQSQNAVHNSHRFLECSTCHVNGTSPGGDDEGKPVNTIACARCHSVPKYNTAAQLHDAHSAADCTICHKTNAGLATATRVHSIIRIIGITLIAVGIIGILVNFIVVRIKLRKSR